MQRNQIIEPASVPTYKVILIGSTEAKKAFINGVRDPELANMPITIGLDFYSAYVCGQYFQIYDLAGQDKFRSIIGAHTKNSAAFIYLDASDEVIKKYERLRDKKSCVAINFNTFSHTPKECLAKIEFLKQEEPKLKLAEAELKQKAVLFMAANKADKDSIVNHLDGDVVGLVVKKLDSFKSDCYNQNVFFKCPPQQANQALLVNNNDNQNENQNENIENNGPCCIQ